MNALWLVLLLWGDPIWIVKPQATVFAGATEFEVGLTASADDVVGVEFFVNKLSVYYAEEPPFSVTLNMRDYANGPIEFKAVVYLFDGSDYAVTLQGENISDFYQEDVQLVRVPVLAEGGREIVKRLGLHDFLLKEDGNPQKLTRAFTEEAPLYVVIVVDLSGSMKSKLPMVKRGMYSFLDYLSPEDSTMVMGFNERVFQVSEFESDKDLLKRRILRLEAEGDTNLYGALWSGIRAAANVNGRRAVLIFTDGNQELSPVSGDVLEKSLEDCVQLAQGEGIPVYTMGVGAFIAPDVLQAIAGETGGECFILKNRSSISDAFASLGKRLGYQFLLGYYSESHRQGWHDIEVLCPDHPDLVLRYPYRLYFR